MNRSAIASWWPRAVIIRLAVLAFAVWLAPAAPAAGAQERRAREGVDHGLVVEEVQHGLVTDEESFQPGDVLLAWRRDGESVTFRI